MKINDTLKNFLIVTLRILEFTFFLKSRLLFNVLFFCFCMFVNKHFAKFTSK